MDRIVTPQWQCAGASMVHLSGQSGRVVRYVNLQP